jgi:SAM-dependent methyltransferase
MAITEEQIRQYADRYIKESGEYTALPERQHLIADWMQKDGSAEGVVADFRRRAMDPQGKDMLEIGFGNGAYVAAFARAGARMHGLEVNQTLFSIAQEYVPQSGVSADLKVYDGEHFPYADASLDAIYSVSVLEHVTNPRAVIQEAARVLKPGGVFYLAFPNRWNPRETHSGFLFIGYWPRFVAQKVLHVLGRRTIEQLNLHFLSYTKMRRLINGTGLKVRYDLHGRGPKLWARKMLSMLGIHHSALLPHVMVVLVKGER